MSLLDFVIILSTGLALISIAILIGLVIWRVVSTRQAAHRAALRRKLMPMLLGSDAPDPQTLRSHARVVADIYQELIGLVRGEERAEFAERAVQFDIHRELIRQSRSAPRRQRARAVQALSQLDCPEVHDALRNALNDRDREVQLIAALALAALDDGPTLEELTGKLSLTDGSTSLLTKSLLRRIAANKPDQFKEFALRPNQNAELRLSALEALAANGDYSIVPLVVDAALVLPEAAPELSRYLDMLAALAHPAAKPAVLRCMTSPSAEIRQAAAKAAGAIRLMESAEILGQLLGDDDWLVRFHAARALLLLGEKGLAQLRRAVEDGGALASEAASKMLAEHGMES